MTTELSQVQTEMGSVAQGMTTNLVRAWNLQCLFNRRQKYFTLLSPVSRDVWVALVDDSRDWLHDDNSWYSVFGTVLCVCCSDGLALALKGLNKYASVISWYWPLEMGNVHWQPFTKAKNLWLCPINAGCTNLLVSLLSVDWSSVIGGA